MPTRRGPFGAIIILSFLILPATLAARGQAQIDLSTAKSLIAQKRYQEARAFLYEYQTKYPLYFEEAEKLQFVIKKAESDYNEAYFALVSAIEKDPNDVKAQQELMKRMRTLDPERFSQNKDFDTIYQARTIKVYLDQAQSVWKRGRDAIGRGQGAQAVAVFREGFGVYRDEFNDPRSSFDPALVASVNAKVRNAEELAAAWSSALPAWEASHQALLAAFDRRPADVQAVLDRDASAIRSLIALRNETAATGRDLMAVYAALSSGAQGREEYSFIPYAWRFMLGRPPAEAALAGDSPTLPEGIVGAMDSVFLQAAARFEAKASARLASVFSQAERSHDAVNPELASSLAAEASAWTRQILRYSSLWTLILAADSAADPATMRRWISQDWVGARAAAALDAVHTERSASLLAAATAAASQAEAVSRNAAATLVPARREGVDTLLRTIDEAIADLERQRLLIASAEASALAMKAEYASYAKGPGALPAEPWLDRQTRLEARLAASRSSDEEAQARLVLERAKAENAAVLLAASADPAVLDGAERDLDGLPSDRKDWENPLRYPVRAAAAVERVLAAARSARPRLAALPARYDSYAPFISGSAGIQAWKGSSANDLANLDAFIARADSLLARARGLMSSAAAYRAQAENFARDARTALGREAFDTARDAIDRARDQRVLSLNLSWDGAWWDSFGAELASLSEQVDRRRREVVVRDRRALLTRGQEAFLQSEFAVARDAFTQAQALWRTAFSTDDPEIEQWLARVRSATAFQTDTELSETHPDYGWVSQQLYTASSAYDRARKLDAAGQKGAAKELLEQKALPAITAVKLEYPRHKEAEILRLRVVILLDRAKGMEEFKTQFDAAVRKVNSRSRVSVQEGLLELQVLQGIDPRYPGMARALSTAQAFLNPKTEFETGITAEDRAAAAEYTRQAQAIWDRRDRAQFPRALELVNLSLQRWPANPAATALKDRLIVEIPGREEVVMTAAEEALYTEAFNALQNNQIVRAQQILERMLSQNAALRGGNRRFQQLYNRAFP